MAESKIKRPFKVVEKNVVLANLTWSQSASGKYYVAYANAVTIASDVKQIVSVTITTWSSFTANLVVQPYITGEKISFLSNAVPTGTCSMGIKVLYI